MSDKKGKKQYGPTTKRAGVTVSDKKGKKQYGPTTKWAGKPFPVNPYKGKKQSRPGGKWAGKSFPDFGDKDLGVWMDEVEAWRKANPEQHRKNLERGRKELKRPKEYEALLRDLRKQSAPKKKPDPQGMEPTDKGGRPYKWEGSRKPPFEQGAARGGRIKEYARGGGVRKTRG